MGGCMPCNTSRTTPLATCTKTCPLVMLSFLRGRVCSTLLATSAQIGQCQLRAVEILQQFRALQVMQVKRGQTSSHTECAGSALASCGLDNLLLYYQRYMPAILPVKSVPSAWV